MLAALVFAVLIVGLSMLAGSVLLFALGARRPIWAEGAIGLAALTVVAGLAVRLPGGAVTAAVLILALLAAGSFAARKGFGPRGSPPDHRADLAGLAVLLVLLAAACLPFLLKGRGGILGEGIYTNDQAAQLYWTDWLQNGFGPEPKRRRVRLSRRPAVVVAAIAEATNASLLDVFNGLLLAIPVLTGLTALALCGAFARSPRIAAASLAGLPFLAASFLAQSAFKETVDGPARARLRGVRPRPSPGEPTAGRTWQRRPRRGDARGLMLVRRERLRLQRPGAGLVRAHRGPIWLVLARTGAARVDSRALRSGAAAAPPGARRGGGVARGRGGVLRRRSSPASSTRSETSRRPRAGSARRSSRARHWGSGPRATSGSSGARSPAPTRRWRWGCWRPRSAPWRPSAAATSALVAVGAAAVIVYVGARLFAVDLRGGEGAGRDGAPGRWWSALGALLGARRQGLGARLPAQASSAGSSPWRCRVSTFLALRAAPVGFDQRGRRARAALAGLVRGETVVFLGVDRFAGYWLRGTLMREPRRLRARGGQGSPEKVWQQGLAMDFDTLSPRRLDDFDYAITTRAGYQSTPPPNFKPVARTDLVRPLEAHRRHAADADHRQGRHPRPRARLRRAAPARGLAGARRGRRRPWSCPSPSLAGARRLEPAGALRRPGTAAQELELAPGRWQLSLQYHSQVASDRLRARGLEAELPASLDGMYLTHQGQGAFWPAGEIERSDGQARYGSP